MSSTMDFQDLRGYLRGLCLIVVVRTMGRAPATSDFERVLDGALASDIGSLLSAVASYTGMHEAALRSAIEELDCTPKCNRGAR